MILNKTNRDLCTAQLLSMGLQGISQFGSIEMQLPHTIIKKKASGIKQFILLRSPLPAQISYLIHSPSPDQA